MIRLYKKRQQIQSVHCTLISQTDISYSSNNKSKEDFKTKLKKHISSDAYRDLESYWKLLDLNNK